MAILNPYDKDIWYDACPITDRILIGNADDACDKDQIQKHSITAILNVMRTMVDFPNYKEIEGLEYRYHPMNDGPGNTTEQFYSAVQSLRELLFKGHTVLVHCRAGISRSVSVTACYLWGTGIYSLDEAINLIKQKRPIADPNPHLLKLIKEIQSKKGR